MWSSFIQLINRWTERLTMIFVVLMVVLIFMQIVSRSVLGITFSWPEEASRFLFIWVVFLGVGFAFQYGANISVEVLVERLPMKWRKFSQIIVLLLCSFFLLILTFQGIDLMSRAMQQMSPSLGIPMGYVYLAIPVSGVLQILNLADITLNFIKNEEYPEGG
jgi:TRAP-type C4-dicarboxylate transport system permease small subunit